MKLTSLVFLKISLIASIFSFSQFMSATCITHHMQTCQSVESNLDHIITTLHTYSCAAPGGPINTATEVTVSIGSQLDLKEYRALLTVSDDGSDFSLSKYNLYNGGETVISGFLSFLKTTPDDGLNSQNYYVSFNDVTTGQAFILKEVTCQSGR